MRGTWLVLLILCLAVVAPVHADRDIVYAARYYTPPGSHRTSHFHLYRINPDGTGKTQLTFGAADEQNPRWSPDGNQIVFLRQGTNGRTALCVMGAAGGSIRTLMPAGSVGTDDYYSYRWSPDGRTLAVAHEAYGKTKNVSVSLMDTRTWRVTRHLLGASRCLWSPDSRRVYLVGARGDTILSVQTGAETPLVVSLDSALWLNNQTLVGLGSNDADKPLSLRFVGMNGDEKKMLTLKMPAAWQDFERRGGDNLLTGFPRPHSLIYAANNQNSTIGVDYLFFLLAADTGRMTYLTEGQFLAGSPEGLRFCTAPGRDTTPYEKRGQPFPIVKEDSAEQKAEAEYRMVWFAPLYVRASAGGSMRQITPRLSYVTGADWRRSPKPSAKRMK